MGKPSRKGGGVKSFSGVEFFFSGVVFFFSGWSNFFSGGVAVTVTVTATVMVDGSGSGDVWSLKTTVLHAWLSAWPGRSALSHSLQKTLVWSFADCLVLCTIRRTR